MLNIVNSPIKNHVLFGYPVKITAVAQKIVFTFFFWKPQFQTFKICKHLRCMVLCIVYYSMYWQHFLLLYLAVAVSKMQQQLLPNLWNWQAKILNSKNYNLPDYKSSPFYFAQLNLLRIVGMTQIRFRYNALFHTVPSQTIPGKCTAGNKLNATIF